MLNDVMHMNLSCIIGRRKRRSALGRSTRKIVAEGAMTAHPVTLTQGNPVIIRDSAIASPKKMTEEDERRKLGTAPGVTPRMKRGRKGARRGRRGGMMEAGGRGETPAVSQTARGERNVDMVAARRGTDRPPVRHRHAID